jgi:putative sterol carrier protein
VPHFADADEIYTFIGGLFTELEADPELSEKFKQANTTVRYEYTDPDAQITIVMREGEPARVDCGDSALTPDLVMTMPADLAHRFWLGKVNVTVALAKGEMRAKGPVAKILKLVPLLKPVFPRYRRLLAESGRQDLLEVD